MTLVRRLDTLRPFFAAAANEVLRGWEQDAEGYCDTYGAGGPCDDISNALSGVIVETFEDTETLDGGWEGDDHAWVVAYTDTEAAGVDIPPSVYETGGGYRWSKRTGVTVEPRDVAIWPIDRRDIDPE